MIVRYIDSPPVVTATGGGGTGIETTGAAVPAVAGVMDEGTPKFEMVEEMWDVVEWDAVGETEVSSVASDAET